MDIDPHAGTITLENGEVVTGDVVLGADGIHSAAKRQLPGGDKTKTFSSGKNAFRFLIARQDALNDPETRELAEELGTWYMFDSPNRRVVIYPCANHELLNFVCIHPDSMSKIHDGSEWDQGASKESLLDVYKDFSPKVQKLLSKADPATLKVWPLLDTDDLPTWVENKLAVLGDAAHPFLPYRASGGAMAIEDAVSLGVMLGRGVRQEDIPERLKLYEKARRTRATTVQQLTRKSSSGPLPPSEGISSPILNAANSQKNPSPSTSTATTSTTIPPSSSASTSGPSPQSTGANPSSSAPCPARVKTSTAKAV